MLLPFPSTRGRQGFGLPTLPVRGYSSACDWVRGAGVRAGSEVTGVDDLSVALVPQVAEDDTVDGVGDGAHRAVGEQRVEPPGVRRAEALGRVVVAEAVLLGRPVGGAGGVQVPAAGVADGVGLLDGAHE